MALDSKVFLKRTCAGVVYIILTGGLTLLSYYTCVLVIAATSVICCYEFLKMSKAKEHKPYTVISCIFACLIPLSFLLSMSVTSHILLAFSIALIGGIVIALAYFKKIEDTIEDLCISIFAFLYTGLMLSSLILLRDTLPGFEGGLIVVFFLLSIWMTDAFAYVGGSAWGKHKFCPSISPKKSWEGVLFGYIGSIIFWLLIPLFIPECGFGYIWAIICAIICATAGIIGDLFESHIKRGFGVKDSGNIMPGHGGLLDRSDSLLSSSIFAYLLVLAAPYVTAFIGFAL